MPKIDRKFVLSDERVNSFGYWVKTDGIDMSRFEKNPVMFFNHWKYDTPIGKWMDVKKEGTTLTGFPDMDEEDGEGLRISKKIKAGYLNAASIGAKIIETSDDPKLIKPGQRYPTVTKCELVEISVTSIPSNSGSIALYIDDPDNPGELIQLTDMSQSALLKPLNNNSSMKTNAKLAVLLSLVGVALADFSDEDEAIQKATEKVQQLKDDRVKTLVTMAKEKGIKGDDASLTAMCASNPDAFLSFVQSNAVPVNESKETKRSIVETITSLSAQTPPVQLSDRDTWTDEQWEKNDPTGYKALQLSDPDKYKQIIERSYGSDVLI